MSRPRAARHRLAVAAATAAAAAAYITYGLVQYATFRVGTFDLVIFDQAVRSYAHFRPGIAPVKGVQDGFGPAFSVLGDHWSPAIALLAPLYWLYDGPQNLIVAQGVLFALAVPPLWAFTRRVCASPAAAYLAAAAYAASWPVAEAVAAGFHEVAFVPLLTAVFFERLAAGRVRIALAAAFALLFVKEDMGLLVTGFGLFLLAARGARFAGWAPGHPLARRRHRIILGGCLVIGGIAAMLLATYALRPALGGRAGYYWAYWSLGGNARLAAGHVLRDPLAAARLAITPRVKLTTMAWLAGVLLFLPLLSPLTLAALPLLAERMLASSQPNWWGTTFQYNAFVEMVLVCAAVDGAARIAGWAARAGRTAAPARAAAHRGPRPGRPVGGDRHRAGLRRGAGGRAPVRPREPGHPRFLRTGQPDAGRSGRGRHDPGGGDGGRRPDARAAAVRTRHRAAVGAVRDLGGLDRRADALHVPVPEPGRPAGPDRGPGTARLPGGLPPRRVSRAAPAVRDPGREPGATRLRHTCVH